MKYLPLSRITCVDPFRRDREDVFDRNLAEFKERIEKVRGWSLPALIGLRQEARRFDLIYIDGDHRREGVMLDSVLFWPMLRAGGILIWDDYVYKQESPLADRPVAAIDGFLVAHAGEYEELYRRRQVIVRKTHDGPYADLRIGVDGLLQGLSWRGRPTTTATSGDTAPSGQTSTSSMRISVCIITYQRPKGLRHVLQALAGQVLGDPAPQVRVVVVDNDEAGSAREVCEWMRGKMPWHLEYAIEARRGIPFARNRCVELARPGSDWIAFIDDDEEPGPGWLAELFRVQATYQADVVTGPVIPRFVGDVPRWAVKGGLFNRLRFATGTRRNRAFTNNVVFRAEIFDRVRPHFDERMVMTGGSDAHFSRRVDRAGYKIIWADQAEVFERFPASRATARWVYLRAYRIGTTTSFIARDLRPLPVAVGSMMAVAFYRFARGLVLAAAGAVLGRHWIVAGVRQIAYGAGMLVGLFGGRYEEYRSTHGG